LYMDIPIGKITAGENVRKGYSKQAIKGLARSISNVGMLQPVIVKKNVDATFTLLVGHRRFEAARLAGVKVIRAIIVDESESKLMLQLIENLQREDLNPIEEAMAYKKILKEQGLTIEELATKIGKPQPSIANTLRLLELPWEVQEMLGRGDIKQGHGKLLLQIADPEKQRRWAERAFQECMSVGALRDAISRGTRMDSTSKQREYNHLLSRLREIRKNTANSNLLINISPEEKLNIKKEIRELIRFLG